MRSYSRLAFLLVLVAIAVLAPLATADAAPPWWAPAYGYHKDVCGSVSGAKARCDAQIVTNSSGTPLTALTAVNGYWPQHLQDAYKLTTAAASAGGSQTVALIESGDLPTAEADLNTYRQNFGLGDCTTSNGCFRKVNQRGGTTPPAVDANWGQETALDLDMVAAICPNCHILLVEADSASFTNLGIAVNEAAALGATQISNSYGGSELFSSSYEGYYNHSGIDITVSSGDSGYGVQFPASSPHVTAVGGTRLVQDTSARGWSETVWSGAGSGCSSTYAKPSWQNDSGCARRTVADVSAVADPNTGVAVYDSTPYGGSSGWMVFGGTSVAAPIIAAVDALAGGRAKTDPFGSYSYNHPADFFDVTSGSNGSCSGSYLCTGKVGYDGPTGVGSPNGASAAAPAQAPVNQNVPVISGTPTDGQTLTASTGTWSNSPTLYAYQWQSCSGGSCAVVGTNSSSYKLVSADVGHTVQVVVTASNTAGNGQATSQPTAQVAPVPPNFSLSISPSSRTIRRGSSTTYTVTITPTGGFSDPVTLSRSGGPSGTTDSFSVNPATTSSVMTVTTSTASTGSYTLTVTGISGSLSHTATATLTIRKK